MIQGILALIISGAILLTLKSLPMFVFKFFKTRFFTGIHLSNRKSHLISQILNYLYETNKQKLKTKELEDVQYFSTATEHNKVKFGVPDGIHFLKYKNKTIIVIYKTEITTTGEVARTLNLTGFSLSSADLKNLIIDSNEFFNNEVNSPDLLSTMTLLNKDLIGPIIIKKRNLDNVILPSSDRLQLEQFLNSFTQNEQKYNNLGLIYKTGILLHGVPGSGKSSLINAIASYLGYNSIYYAKCDDISRLVGMLEYTKSKIIVLEDVDMLSHALVRTSYDAMKKDIKDTYSDNLLLDLLDGRFCNSTKIFILTTNHINRLDEALIRAGRIDFMLELKHLCLEQFNLFCAKYYGKTTNKTVIKIGKAMSDLQTDYLNSMSFEELEEKYLE